MKSEVRFTASDVGGEGGSPTHSGGLDAPDTMQSNVTASLLYDRQKNAQDRHGRCYCRPLIESDIFSMPNDLD